MEGSSRRLLVPQGTPSLLPGGLAFLGVRMGRRGGPCLGGSGGHVGGGVVFLLATALVVRLPRGVGFWLSLTCEPLNVELSQSPVLVEREEEVGVGVEEAVDDGPPSSCSQVFSTLSTSPANSSSSCLWSTISGGTWCMLGSGEPWVCRLCG